MYKSLKDLPAHKAGDYLVENEEYYVWSTPPYFNFPKGEIEDYPEWFELAISDWDNGETFYYLNSNFEVVEKEFNAMQHHKLVLNGNAFKERDEVVWLSKNIDKLLNDDDLIITDNNEIKKIVSLLKTNNSEEAIKLLMDML
jgi:hypothetical protein